MIKTLLLMLSRMIDRIIFTFCFILGVQVPEFIQQYSQRLSGHLNEAKHHLQQFQFIADTQYQGDLPSLIINYQDNSDKAIKQTGELVESLIARVEVFSSEIRQLEQTNYIDRVLYFFKQLDPEMTYATAKQFSLAIPLTPSALLTGITFALAIIITKFLFIFLLRRTYQLLKNIKRKKLAG